jgi:high-affinity nickel permease
MDNHPNPPISRKSILWFVVILLVIATVWFLIASINNSVKQALSPLRQANSLLGTQVSELLHPTPTILPDPVTIIHEVRALARLETIQYSVEKVITAEENQGLFGPLFGDRLLFVAHGMVIAGIDMEKMSPTGLSLQNEVLNVSLPPAEVFVATLDNQKSYVYDRQTGLLTHGDVNLETAARQAAENQIRQAALDDGILALAQQNAETYLTRFFLSLGYPDVIFVTPGAP